MRIPSRSLLADRYLNKGTAFTAAERREFGLDGLLPPVIENLATQLERVAFEYDTKDTDLERHVYLRALQDRNSVLFYAFLAQNLDGLLPIVYTPTVGVACEQWSRIYRREHGLFLSWPQRDRADELLDNAVGDRDIDVVVVTDGERVLGLSAAVQVEILLGNTGTALALENVGYVVADLTAKVGYGLLIYLIAKRKSELEGLVPATIGETADPPAKRTSRKV